MAAGTTLRLRLAAFMGAALWTTAVNVIRRPHEVNHDPQEDVSTLAELSTINVGHLDADAGIPTSHLESTKMTFMRPIDHPLTADLMNDSESMMIGPSGQTESAKRAVIQAPQRTAESSNIYVTVAADAEVDVPYALVRGLQREPVSTESTLEIDEGAEVAISDNGVVRDPPTSGTLEILLGGIIIVLSFAAVYCCYAFVGRSASEVDGYRSNEERMRSSPVVIRLDVGDTSAEEEAPSGVKRVLTDPARSRHVPGAELKETLDIRRMCSEGARGSTFHSEDFGGT